MQVTLYTGNSYIRYNQWPWLITMMYFVFYTDGTNYSLWCYMVRHVLVAKGLSYVVHGHYNRLALERTIIVGVEEGAVVDDATGPAVLQVLLLLQVLMM